jgi:hypothetical protein
MRSTIAILVLLIGISSVSSLIFTRLSRLHRINVDTNLKARNPDGSISGDYIPFDDEDGTPFPKDDDDNETDLEFEKKMAMEQYNEIKGDNEMVSFDQFMAWEELRDVMDKNIDIDTLITILIDCGTIKEQLPFNTQDGCFDMKAAKPILEKTYFTFDEFFNTIDIVNKVNLAIEEGIDMDVLGKIM